MDPLRRLSRFVFALTVVQQVFFSVLAPLLPSLDTAIGLSKAEAGILVGSFSVGLGLMALPVGFLASRLKVDWIALAGLAVLVCACIGFGLADSYRTLLAARFAQGAGAGLCWSAGLAWLVSAAPRARRGEMIGLFSGASAAGQLLGAAVGGVAAVVGRLSTFGVAAVFAAAVGVIGTRFDAPPAPRDRQSFALIRNAHRSPAILRRIWLVALPGLLSGTVFVLAPLQLARLDLGPVQISATFFGAAALGVFVRPWVGRWADVRGYEVSIRLVLVLSIVVTITMPFLQSGWAAAICAGFAVTSYGVLQAPAMAFLSQAYERAGLAQVLGFALMGFNLGVGFFVGSAIAGEVANLAGDVTAYSLAAGSCVATLVALAPPRNP